MSASEYGESVGIFFSTVAFLVSSHSLLVVPVLPTLSHVLENFGYMQVACSVIAFAEIYSSLLLAFYCNQTRMARRQDGKKCLHVCHLITETKSSG